ncbi:MAG: energy-coupling factor transporter transmembrane component T [Christensenellales bacterium]
MKTLDPRIKLFSVIIITSLALYYRRPLWMLILSVSAFFMTVMLGADFAAFFKRIRRFFGLLLMISLLQIIFVRTGEPLLTVNGFALIYGDGLSRGVSVSLRFFVIICSAAVMAGENSRRVVASLIKLKMPYTFVFMIMITLRFVPVFAESFSDAITSVQLRGIELKKVKLGKRIRLYSHLLLPVVADSVIKSQELSIAMEARGFGAMKKRTAYINVRLALCDYIVLALLITLGAGAFAAYGIYA